MLLRLFVYSSIFFASHGFVRRVPAFAYPTGPRQMSFENRHFPQAQFPRHPGKLQFGHQVQQHVWNPQTVPVVQSNSQFEVPAPGSEIPSSGRKCPLSPFAEFLTDGEQEALHELIVEARSTGASEPEIKEHINSYLKQILSPVKLAQFEEANARFERDRLSKFSGQGMHPGIMNDDVLAGNTVYDSKNNDTESRLSGILNPTEQRL